MTDIEQKALALLNEVRDERGFRLNVEMQREDMAQEALCRAIEQHEAFRQEVSDAIEEMLDTPGCVIRNYIGRFIIAKPDPLVEALEEASGTNDPVEWANRFYAAIEKRGGKIVWGKG